MSNKLLAISVASLCIVCIIALAGIFHFTAYSAVHAESHVSSVSTQSTNAPGMPAISPTLSQDNPNAPSFTKADVQAYITAHPAPPRMTLAEGYTVKILTTDFISSKEASQRMQGEYVGLPDTVLVCYVTLQGPFLLSHVSSPFGAKPFAPSETVTEVFDAHTGNLLVSGTP